MKQTARQSRSLLLPLICFEAAQMCVMNKLRTSLGKPPETFTAFETALKAIAKDVAAVDGKSMAMITRSRVFVEFMEWLEKVWIFFLNFECIVILFLCFFRRFIMRPRAQR